MLLQSYTRKDLIDLVMDNIVISMFSNSLIIFLTGAILNFIFNNPIGGWILLGLFGFTCVLGIILYKKYKKDK